MTRAVVVGNADRSGSSSEFQPPIFQPFVWFTEDGGRTGWRNGEVSDGVVSLHDVDLVP